MPAHERDGDVTNVVYPGAGHVFLVQEFLPPSSPGAVPLYDFGGTTGADMSAGQDAWRRVVAFLGSDSRS